MDPLMDVGTPREIKLAMLSLIKIFKDIDMEKRSLSWNEKPELPAHIKAADVQQVGTLSHDRASFLSIWPPGMLCPHPNPYTADWLLV